MGADYRASSLSQLVDTGKKRGWVLYDEILALLPPDWESGREIDDILAALDRAEVEIREQPEILSDEQAYGTPADMDDPLGVYLREVNTVPPLTRESEIELVKRIRRGGPEAEAARKTLVEANLKPVIAIARRHAPPGLYVMDLIVEGNSGLMMAVDTFDPTRGGKFSTHARWWARHAVVRAASRD